MQAIYEPRITVVLTRSQVRQRYIIPNSLLVNKDDLANWGLSLMTVEEIRQRLIRAGHENAGVSDRTLNNWERLIQLRVGKKGKRSPSREIFIPDEVRQLDDLYIATHIIKLSRQQYHAIVRTGRTLEAFIKDPSFKVKK